MTERSGIEQVAGRRWVIGVLLVLMGVTAVLTARFGQTFASGADESGYLHAARLVRTEKWVGEVRPVAGLPLEALDRAVYQALGFEVAKDRSRQMPTYPFGLPFLIAGLGALAGEAEGVRWALGLIALSVPGLMYRLGRDSGLERPWALAGAAVLMASPLIWFVALRPLSDGLSLVLVMAVVVVAARAHRGLAWALALGALIAWAVLTRMPNALVVAPVLWLLVPRWREVRWWAIAAGGAPGAAVLLGLNQALYGSPWTSGYIGLEDLFKVAYLPGTLGFFGWWMLLLLSPVVVVGLGLAVLPLDRSLGEGRARGAAWWWLIGFVVFYGLYRHSRDGWFSLRFVLPAFPAVVVLAGLGWRSGLRRWGGARRRMVAWVGTVVALVALGWNLDRTHRMITLEDPHQDVYVRWETWAREHLAPADVCVGMQITGSVFYALPNAWVRYDHLKPATWAAVQQAVARTGGQLYAPLFDFEVDDYRALAECAPGAWKVVSDLGDIKIYRLEPVP